MALSPREQVIMRFAQNRFMAHQVLFKHRHKDATPPFQRQLIDDWHSGALWTNHLVFRGGGKSTIAEEAILLKAPFREFKNCLLLGENAERAMDRLRAIKIEMETNQAYIDVFGDLRGSMWADDRVILSTGAMIQCLGRGQALRGIKHGEQRPDLIFADDIETRFDMRDPDSRKKVYDWFFADVLPACDPNYRCHMAATPLHPESLAMLLNNDPRWTTRRFPIYYLNDEGEQVSSWPERFPIHRIEGIENLYFSTGQMQSFRAEYLCDPDAPEAKSFKTEQMRVEPRVRRWESIYTMTDPARTVGKRSADTGHAAWSWIGSKLVIWDAWARQLMPNEIVGAIFDSMEQYRPIWTGVEEDGLNQFLMQPIREEAIRRGVSLPVRAVRAPVGKRDFIRGLQPFFLAGEVEFAKPLPELQQQLVGFPNGKIDAPNALAYALKMRPGAPIYGDFRDTVHIAEGIRPISNQPAWLALNATHSSLTAMLVQSDGASIRIFADWVIEGAPSELLSQIIGAAQLSAGKRVQLTAGPLHFDQYNNVGLRQAAARIPIEVQASVPPAMGRPMLADMLRREHKGRPAIQVSPEAVWTLNALAGGYSKVLHKDGRLADYAEEGPYRTLIEGLESLCGLFEVASPDRQNDAIVYGTLPNGQRYVTARR